MRRRRPRQLMECVEALRIAVEPLNRLQIGPLCWFSTCYDIKSWIRSASIAIFQAGGNLFDAIDGSLKTRWRADSTSTLSRWTGGCCEDSDCKWKIFRGMFSSTSLKGKSTGCRWLSDNVSFFFLARFAYYDAPVTGYSADLSASNNIILGVKIVFLFLNSRIE